MNKNTSEYIINDKGKKVSIEKISRGFASVRNKAELSWDGAPSSFHEIRSLSVRLYKEKMGHKFTPKLFGHKSAKMTEKYQDDRKLIFIISIFNEMAILALVFLLYIFYLILALLLILYISTIFGFL
ncbi:MAG: tyrosine-type recombinase/integrase [Arsenophonus endosymbiont of Dermacentor nuttalli]